MDTMQGATFSSEALTIHTPIKTATKNIFGVQYLAQRYFDMGIARVEIQTTDALIPPEPLTFKLPQRNALQHRSYVTAASWIPHTQNG